MLKKVTFHRTGKSSGGFSSSWHNCRARAKVDFELRRCPSFDRAQRKTANHLQSELELLPLGFIGQRAQTIETSLCERERLAEAKQRDGAIGRDEEEFRARCELPGRLVEHGEPGRYRGCVGAVVRRERPDDRLGQRHPTGRLQRGEQHVLVEHVDEPVPQRQRAVGELLLLSALEEHVHALQRLETILHFGPVHLQRLDEDRRIELASLHAGSEQQPSILLFESVDLPRDHASHRCREIARDVGHRARQHPGAALLDDAARVAQIAHEIGHEQRASLGLCVDCRGKVFQESVTGELQCQGTAPRREAGETPAESPETGRASAGRSEQRGRDASTGPSPTAGSS